GGATLAAFPRGRVPAGEPGLKADGPQTRINWLIALALAAAAFTLYLGIRWSLGRELVPGLWIAMDTLGVVCLWLTPVALAWRGPSATSRRALIPGLVLVALPGIANPLLGAIQPIANLSGIGNEISQLFMIISVAGYLLVGRELIHLAPATLQHR